MVTIVLFTGTTLDDDNDGSIIAMDVDDIVD